MEYLRVNLSESIIISQSHPYHQLEFCRFSKTIILVKMGCTLVLGQLLLVVIPSCQLYISLVLLVCQEIPC